MQTNSLDSSDIHTRNPSEFGSAYDYPTSTFQDPNFEPQPPAEHSVNPESFSHENSRYTDTIQTPTTGKSARRIEDSARSSSNTIQDKQFRSPTTLFESEGFNSSMQHGDESNHADTAHLSDSEEPSSECLTSKGRGKSAHNVIEQRYRNKINDRFAALQQTVPTLRVTQKKNTGGPEHIENDVVYGMSDGNYSSELCGLQPATKLNKGTILAKTVEYIKFLEAKNRELSMEYEQVHLKAKMLGLDNVDSCLQGPDNFQTRK